MFIRGSKELLVGIVTSVRYVGDEINAKLAHSEADALHEAVKLDKKESYEEAIRILTTRSKTQLIATFNCYREVHGTSTTKVIRNVINKVGSDEDAMRRVIVSRVEKDLKIISQVYYKKNNVLLMHAVAKETSGFYLFFLLALLTLQK